MDQDQADEIIEKIIELAHLLGWNATLSQNSNGDLLGMNIGSAKFLEYKAGYDPSKPSH